MKHLNAITKKPVTAQFESLLQLISLFNSLLGLLKSVADTFGIDLPQKDQA